MRIALAGNPNSGKTTLFNALTGANEKIGNWAGVTVEHKERPLKGQFCPKGEKWTVVDLPGTYSISPFTGEEAVTGDYILHKHPDVLINVVDATNLSRSLFFTTQLLELGIPTVIALNKSDINQKEQTQINTLLLSTLLGCPVVETASSEPEGLVTVMEQVAAVMGKNQSAPFKTGGVDRTNKHSVKEADKKRFAFVDSVTKQVKSRNGISNRLETQDKIDKLITNRWLGLPLFALVMFLVFQISQGWLGPFLGDTLAGWMEQVQTWAGGMLEGAHPLVTALLVDGIIGGVGAVMGFLPLVMVMYFLLALLEDCGYMARVSVVLDPIFKKVGLSGKSVIPFVIGTGCAIPGIMACRTIRDERERRAAAMLTPFMPCGAKLPVIALFAGVFFEDASWVGTAMYFAGISLIFIGALLINSITGNRRKRSYFIIELPQYKVPSLSRALASMCSRGWAYIVKAGTIILLCNTAVQLMQSFTLSFTPVEEGMAHTSILATVASPFAFLLIPLGFGAWQMAAAAITGFIAKENVVGTLAVCYGITNFINVEELALTGGASEVAGIFALSKAAALACLMFNLFTPPCFAAIGAMNSEMKNKKWFWGGLGLQFATGYTVSFLVYQTGTLMATGTVGRGFVPGLVAVTCMIGVITFLCIKGERNMAKKLSLKK